MRKLALALILLAACRTEYKDAPKNTTAMPASVPMQGQQVGGVAPPHTAMYAKTSLRERDVEHNTEEYGRFEENPFLRPADHPLSTFSIDVDRASYANVRRFLRNGVRPPRDAVRIEEMINYFTYDCDFNVGVTSDGELEQLIEDKRRDGIFLTVLGFGSGNLKDSKMELLADKGNGNYSYIDTIAEARKSLVREMGATLFTVAKDVKIQVEFNPATVGAYRLIGYENRLLRAEDFNNDAKDAGELGAGHSVTALYEIVPPGGDVPNAEVDPLKYQARTASAGGAELATVKLRYKEPQGALSKLMTRVVTTATETVPSQNFRLASSVAQLGMLLRDSPHKGTATFESIPRIDAEDFAEIVAKARTVEAPKSAGF